MEDVGLSLRLKGLWKVFIEDSLWSGFFKATYFRHSHAMLAGTQGRGSKALRSTLAFKEFMLNRSRWLLGSGNTYFWLDNWTGTGPLLDHVDNPLQIDLNLKFKDAWDEGGLWRQEIIDAIDSEAAGDSVVIHNFVPTGRDDVLVWTPFADGNFSTKSAWHEVRSSCAVVPYARWLWNQTVPLKVVFFSCPRCETTDHCLVSGGTAAKGGSAPFQDWWPRFSQKQLDSSMPWTWDPSPRRGRPIPVYWCPPNVSVKLNVDGACRGNPGLGGGGGVVRNTRGEVLAAFSNFYGYYTNSIAELRALRDGIALCQALGFSDVVVNSDSANTARMINQNRCNLWQGWYWFQEIMSLVSEGRASVVFAFRESNRAADWLANLACDSGSSITFHQDDIPSSKLQVILREDKAGLPMLRS
ncbi:uncharacterized protein LOC122645214 [Telopea speciosissima]|uniref:uncharacterized protein LOC122645214 n=1 Tax=Telopea speciosissima TaxID=54955 RepID=UPI001CC45629|nr:uncharacterized protein LOC122645214 [Telopea speciosissima]